jgi:mannan endo-1,4-beta-mannosidase
MSEHGVTQNSTRSAVWRFNHRTLICMAAICAVLLAGAGILIAGIVPSAPAQSADPAPGMYFGLYVRGVPVTYDGVAGFTGATGVRPDVVMYYSSWAEPFQTGFAATAAEHGAVTLVQINPVGVSLAAIAAGRYDDYLDSYAEAVRSFGRQVILGFGHEMNGPWNAWGYQRTSPAVFVAAWRHIVNVFRGLEARNVTWLWTVNIIDPLGDIPSPGPWWPGSSYVTWVGIDGYYYTPSSTFAPLFGPTIAAVRALTTKPILIAETGVAPAAGQAAKIADLFAGVHLYGLLGFVWFDAFVVRDWRLNNAAGVAALRHGIETYRRSGS